MQSGVMERWKTFQQKLFGDQGHEHGFFLVASLSIFVFVLGPGEL
jgi:hypothetical protein